MAYVVPDPLSSLKATLAEMARRAKEAEVPTRRWTGNQIEGNPDRLAFMGGAAAAEELACESKARLKALADQLADSLPDQPLDKTLDHRGMSDVLRDTPLNVRETESAPQGHPTPVEPLINQTLPLTTPPSFPSPIDASKNLMATLDGQLAVTPPMHITLPTARLAQTIDSLPPDANQPAADGEEAKPGTVPDRRLLQTMDGGVPAENVEQLEKIWRGTYTPETKPSMTIKGSEPPAARDSRLVIKPRAMRHRTTQSIPDHSAEYELIEVLGEGGMGVVYAARQSSIDRTVAVKMLKPDMARDTELREKFLSEAVVTGDLDHPNIVPIYDLGANEGGALFYSMKKVQGTPWMKVLGQKTQHENIEVLLKVADAVGFAHSRGVIHRDLKPENVMLGDFGEVLVMDWGLAMSTSLFRKAGSITQSGSMGGTPAYMAPEMAAGPLTKVGPLSDVYLLGAILFEIITGKPPHTGKTVMNCLFSAAKNDIRETDHAGELIDVAKQSMATSPADRYPNVREFQNAIRLYQSHSESIALSTRAEEDLSEAAASGDYQAYSRAVFAYEEALSLWDQNPKARPGLSQARLAYARSAEKKGDYDLGASLLDPHDLDHVDLARKITAAQRERNARQARLKHFKRMAAALAAGVVVTVTVAFYQIRAQRDLAKNAEIAATEQRDAATLAQKQAAADREKALKAEKDALDQKTKADTNAVQALAAEKTAREAEMQARKDRDAAQKAKDKEEYEAYIAKIGLIAAKIDENSFETAESLLQECNPELRNWEWGRLLHLCRQSVHTFEADRPLESIAYAADGKRFVTGGWDGLVRLWNIETGKVEKEIPYGGRYVHAVAISPNGKMVAAGGNDKAGFVKVWNLETGELVQSLKEHKDSVVSVAFSKNNRQLLTASYDKTARLWDLTNGKHGVLQGHHWWVWSARFSPQEDRIATASQDGTVIVWNAATGEPGPPFTGHTGPVYSASFSPDGKQVVSGGYDNRVLLWRPEDVQPFDYAKHIAGKQNPPPKFRALEGHGGPVRTVQYSRDGRFLLSGSYDNSIKLWDAVAGKVLKTLRGHAGRVQACDFSPDGTGVISASQDTRAKIWSLAGYEEVRVLHAKLLHGHADAILSASFSRDGKQIVTASRDRTARLWSVAGGREQRRLEEGHEFLASTGAFFPDGQRVLTAAVDNTARIWDVAAGAQRAKLDHTGRAAVAAVSHDGFFVLTGSDDMTAKLWDVANPAEPVVLRGHNSEVTCVAFSRDDHALFTGDDNGNGFLWNSQGKQLFSLRGHNGKIVSAVFSPDGKRLLTASTDNSVAQWDVESGKELLPLVLRHPGAVTALDLAPDGRRAITACEDGRIRRWDVERATIVGTLELNGAPVSTVSISPDGRRVVTASAEDRAVRIFDLNSGREATRPGDAQHSLIDLEAHGALAWSAVFSPDSRRVLTVGGNGARIWDAETGAEGMSLSPNGAMAAASFSPDAQLVVTGSWDNSAKIWEAATGKVLRKLTGEHHGYVNSAVFSPAGDKILTASDDHTAKLWNAATGEVLLSLDEHSDRVRQAAFSRDGSKIVTGSSDKTAIVWDAATGKKLQTLAGHEWSVQAVAFSQDGSRVITGSEDNSARIWNSETGEHLLTISGHTAGVASVALSDDGKRALTGSQDNTVKVWDAETGTEILTLKGHVQEVTSVSFSTDSRMILSASRDGKAIVWLTSDWREAEKKPDPFE